MVLNVDGRYFNFVKFRQINYELRFYRVTRLIIELDSVGTKYLLFIIFVCWSPVSSVQPGWRASALLSSVVTALPQSVSQSRANVFVRKVGR